MHIQKWSTRRRAEKLAQVLRETTPLHLPEICVSLLFRSVSLGWEGQPHVATLGKGSGCGAQIP